MITTKTTNNLNASHDVQSTLCNWNLMNIYECMTLDKLHKIEKGVFCHLLKWFMMMVKDNYGIVGLREIDW